MEWDKKERRKVPQHSEPLAECMERYKAICDKLDGLINRLDKINGRYDAHLLESITYRSAVDSHTKKFEQMEDQTRWIIGILVSLIVTILIQISTFAFLWGQLTKTVESSQDRLTQIEQIHPRVTSGGIPINK